MNWEAIAATGEIIGAIAVVISLIYLTLEVRSNTRVMKANSARDAQIQWATFNEMIFQSPDRIVLSKAFDPEMTASDFSEEERHIIFFFARAIGKRQNRLF